MYCIVDPNHTQDIEIVYSDESSSSDPAIIIEVVGSSNSNKATGNNSEKASTLPLHNKKMTETIRGSSMSTIIASPEITTPRSSNVGLGLDDEEPRFSNLSEEAEEGTTKNGSASNSKNKEESTNKSQQQQQHANESTTTESPSSTPSGNNSNNEVSRRLVEYFVVVSCIPKEVRKHPPKEGGGEITPRPSSSANNGRQISEGSVNSQQRQAARMDSRRAHLNSNDDSPGGGIGGGSALLSANNNAAAPASTTASQSQQTDNQKLPPPISIQLPTPEDIFGEPFPDERKSIQSVQETDTILEQNLTSHIISSPEKSIEEYLQETEKLLNNQCLKLGETLFVANPDQLPTSSGGYTNGTDDKSATSSSVSSTTQAFKSTFMKSVSQSKKKLQANTSKMNKSMNESKKKIQEHIAKMDEPKYSGGNSNNNNNDGSLLKKFQTRLSEMDDEKQRKNNISQGGGGGVMQQNLEKTLENMKLDKTLAKFKSMKILAPMASSAKEDSQIYTGMTDGVNGIGNIYNNVDDDQSSSSSDSSFSLDGGGAANGTNERQSSEGSTFFPSKNPISSRKTTPVPLSPTPPPPSAVSSLSTSYKHSPFGPTDNIRVTPLPDRTHAKQQGATENIRLGGAETPTGSREYNDDIDDCILEPVITAQYPPVDHPDQPLNPMLPHFCYPHGTDAIVPLHEYKMPTVHYFVLTDATGGKLYGTCLTVYEEFEPHPSDVDILSGEDDDDLDHTPRDEEGQERGYVECTVNGSPKAGRARRRAKDHKYYAPRVLCLLSTWPYLSAYRTYLTKLYQLATTTNLMIAPLERYILNICSEVPAPPPGSFEVKLSILDSDIRFWAPPANQPIPYVSLPYDVLFECLDIGNVLFAWYTLACERKMLLVSSQLSLLAVCAEILCSMIFPMRWSHLYIPCLPRFLTPMLDAPMPYLCGISRDVFPYAVGEISDETVVVDLDRNVITMGMHTPDLPMLPHRRKLKLEAALEKHAGDVFWNARGLTKTQVQEVRSGGDVDLLASMLGKADAVWDEKIVGMDEAFNFAPAPDSMTLLYADEHNGKQSRWDAVQEAFLRFYVSMLKDYKKFMPSTPKDRQSWRGPASDFGERFRAEEFVQSQLLDFHPFLEELIGTQQFDDFVTRRMYNAGDAPDVKFFDQSIDAKRNRSRLRLKKKDTPFLHSAVAHREMKQVDAIQPNSINLPSRSRFDSRFDFKKGQYTYPTWPESFDETLYGKARPIPRIITAEYDRRSALNAMLKAKHWVAEETKLPGSNNPSAEATAFVLFFVTFSNTIGKEWTEMEKDNAILGGNLLDHYVDGSSVTSSVSEGPWAPKVNPPWMAGEGFQSLHSTFRPAEKKAEPTEQIVHDEEPASNGFCAPDCNDLCLGKAIDPSTYIGIPWSRNTVSTDVETGTQNLECVQSPRDEELVNEIEKARAIAKAQIDLGFNTLKMMRLRKLPTESITYKQLIEACGRCGIAHRAQQLMEMMTQDGLQLDSEVYFAFIKAFSNAESDAASPYNNVADTTSEFSTNKSNPSVTSSSLSFLNSAHSEDPSLKSMKGSGKLIDGFQHAMSSSIAANRRAFKNAKTNRIKRLNKQKLTTLKDLHVTNAIKTHLELGYCILEDLYPGVKIDANSDTCPKCSCVLGQDSVILGWKPCQVKDFSTACPSCKHRFVPKFSVSCKLESFEGSQGTGTPLYCDYLSPWVLLQEIRSLISAPVGGKVADILGVDSNDWIGIDGIIDPKFREGNGINATLWWNMIVTFNRFKVPITFLLQGSYEDQQLIMPTMEDML